MNNIMTNETPGKVMGLLGTALFSLAFMFAVSVTDASFSGTAMAIPDPFGPEQVMAVIDQVSNSYSVFVAENLVVPFKQDMAMVADNASWVAENSGQELASIFGVQVNGYERAVSVAVAEPQVQGKVAGASTTRYQSGGISIDKLYDFLVQ